MELKKSVPEIVINPITNWTNIPHIITNLLFYVGEYMHSAIFFLGLFTLRNNLTMYFLFFTGLCLSAILNLLFKKIIKIRRPVINKHLFDLCLKNKEDYVYRNDKRYHIYGMPSGHSQICGYAFAFFSLFMKDFYISVFYLIITIITMYQRVKYEHHTILQVIIGVSIGCLIGIGVYTYAKKKIAGNLAEKDDDNCYL